MQLLPAIIMPVSASVVEAENALIEALERLSDLRLAALTGGRYDADEYDAAVIAFRHARATAEDARLAWSQVRAQQAASYYMA
jgi:hypothetical protein